MKEVRPANPPPPRSDLIQISPVSSNVPNDCFRPETRGATQAAQFVRWFPSPRTELHLRISSEGLNSTSIHQQQLCITSFKLISSYNTNSSSSAVITCVNAHVACMSPDVNSCSSSSISSYKRQKTIHVQH